MNGPKKTYREYLATLPPKQEPKIPRAYVDMRGIVKYAKDRGITVEEMTRAEKDQFVTYYEDPSGYNLP